MIEDKFVRHIAAHAYVPEHLPAYVCSVSRAEAFLRGEYLCYLKGDHMAFVGYPLREGFGDDEIEDSLMEALREFRPKRLSLMCRMIPSHVKGGILVRGTSCDGAKLEGKPRRPRGKTLRLEAEAPECSDWYYRLKLSCARVPPKVANMVRRASRDIRVEKGGSLGDEHESLIRSFLSSRPLDQGTREIMERVPAYVRNVSTARLYSAWDHKGRLVAFDVGDFGAERYAFYMFNFRSADAYVPGTSDLLLQRIITDARASGKEFLNLGLGINPGVSRFKEKWGATRFLPYKLRLYRSKGASMLDALLWRASGRS